MKERPKRTIMGSEVHVLFSDVNEARKFAKEACDVKSVIRVGLVRPVVRRRPIGEKLEVEVDDYNKLSPSTS